MSIHSSNNRVGGSESMIYSTESFCPCVMDLLLPVALLFLLEDVCLSLLIALGVSEEHQQGWSRKMSILFSWPSTILLFDVLHRVPWRLYKETLLQCGVPQFVQKIRVTIRLALAPITCCIFNPNFFGM